MPYLDSKIDDNETILRTILNSAHLNKSKKKVVAAAFKPPFRKPDEVDRTQGSNKISVLRADFTSMNFCKKKGKELSDSSSHRAYYGFGYLLASSIRSIKTNLDLLPIIKPDQCDVEYHPVADNFVHANITLPYIFPLVPLRLREPAPPELSYCAKALSRKVTLVIDHNPNSAEWPK